MEKTHTPEHGRLSIVEFAKRFWARAWSMLRNPWTWRIGTILFRLLVWVAKKFDWF